MSEVLCLKCLVDVFRTFNVSKNDVPEIFCVLRTFLGCFRTLDIFGTSIGLKLDVLVTSHELFFGCSRFCVLVMSQGLFLDVQGFESLKSLADVLRTFYVATNDVTWIFCILKTFLEFL